MSEPSSIAFIEDPSQFPPTSNALANPDGLLAASAFIGPDWLKASYTKGIFPWYSENEPVLWWSPSPRAVLYTEDFKLHKSLRKTLRKVQKQPERSVTLNNQFEAVIRGCAMPRADGLGTWISEDIVNSYLQLHRQGLAHSVEHWCQGQLVGGLYCVGMGGMVF